MRFSSSQPIAAVLGIAAAVGLVATSCGSTGRDLRAPVPGAVSPTRHTQAPTPTGDASGPFRVTSNSFVDGGEIPSTFTCDGPSPDLAWSGTMPAGTVELALVVSEPEADNFVHWFVAGIAAAPAVVASGKTPKDVAQLTNSAGKAGYSGPCPSGGVHNYRFEVLALSKPAQIPLTTPAKQAYADIQPKVIERAILTGTVGAPTPVASVSTPAPAGSDAAGGSAPTSTTG